MFSSLSYLLTSKFITLYILYTLHVILGTSLVFTALYTYSVHSSRAMARAAAIDAETRMLGTSVNEMGGLKGLRGMGVRGMEMEMGMEMSNGSAVEFEDDMDDEIEVDVDGVDVAIGGLGSGLNGMRKVKSMMMGLSRSTSTSTRTGRAGWENISCDGNVDMDMAMSGIKFREVCYSSGGKIEVPVVGGKGMIVEIS